MLLIICLILLITLPCGGMNPHSETVSIYRLPPDIILFIVQKLPFTDQLSLKTTCKYLNSFPAHAEHLKPIYPLQSTDRREFVSLWSGVFAYVSSLCILNAAKNFYEQLDQSDQETYSKQLSMGIASLAFFTGAALGYLAYTRGTLRKFMQESISSSYALHQKDLATQLAELTHKHRNIAKRLTKGHITTNILHIDYCKQSQAGPLLKAARTLKIPHLTIALHGSYNPETFNLSTALTKYNHLKSLEITGKGSWHPFAEEIDTRNFCKTLNHTTTLEKLSLSSFNISPLILDSITTCQTITEISLSYVFSYAPYDFRNIAHNRTLKSLSLKNCGIADSAVPHIMTFLAHNRSLTSFILESSLLVDRSIEILNSSHHKPEHFIVTR